MAEHTSIKNDPLKTPLHTTDPTLSILKENDNYFQVSQGVFGIKDILVNMYIVENEQDGTWVLIDTGLRTSAKKIKDLAEGLYGVGTKPKCILLTHGHFDHVGSLKKLVEEWDVPVYAHALEMPFLTGLASYPPPDPTVGGGMMARLAWMYPKHPIDLSDRICVLPVDGSVPGLPDWRCIFTPGHSPGHVSFYHDRSRVLIAGDAFVTTRQESLVAVMTQAEELNGPPKYFTCDWEAAETSVEKLAAMQPWIVATGHGKPMEGSEMQEALEELALHFRSMAIPIHGRYINEPAITDENGVRYIPPPYHSAASYVVKGLAFAALAGGVWYLLTQNKQPQRRNRSRGQRR